MSAGPDISRHFNRALAAAKENWGTILGAIVVAYLLTIITVYIMCCGLFGATLILAARIMRGERLTVGHIFDIARGHYLRTFGTLLLIALMFYAAGIVLMGLPMLAMWLAATRIFEVRSDAIALLVFLSALPGFGILACWQYWIMVRWLFVIPLMVDTGMTFSEARAMSARWVKERGGFWMHLLFFIVANLVAGIGELACCVGLLFTMPLGLAMIASLYDEHFEAEGLKRAPLPVRA